MHILILCLLLIIIGMMIYGAVRVRKTAVQVEPTYQQAEVWLAQAKALTPTLLTQWQDMTSKINVMYDKLRQFLPS